MSRQVEDGIMLNRANQALTLNPNNLLIGIANVHIGGEDMGSVTTASIEVSSTVKERYVGYPAQRHETEVEGVTAIATVEAEEIGGAAAISIVQNLFNNLETQGSTTMDIEMYAPYALGGNLKLSATTQILPELTLSWKDDWNSIKFKFEAIAQSAMQLLQRTTIAGPTKTVATTIDPRKLSIGKPKVLINDISVGALQAADVNLKGNVKKIETGYPKCTSKIIYLDSQFDIVLTTEETITSGVDSKVEIQQALVDGGYLSLTFEHCRILPDLGVDTKNDWLGFKQRILPFKVDGESLVTFERRVNP